VSSNSNLQIHNGTKIKIFSKLLEEQNENNNKIRKRSIVSLCPIQFIHGSYDQFFTIVIWSKFSTCNWQHGRAINTPARFNWQHRRAINTPARLNTCLVSIYDPRIPRICLARKSTFGNWISWIRHQTRGSTHAVEITNNLLNRHNSLTTKTSSTKSKWKRKITWVHCRNRNINLHSQTFSQLEKPLYPLHMYKIKSLKNCCYISSIFLQGLFAPKNTMIVHLEDPHLFLLGCWSWLVFITTFSTSIYIFLWTTNLRCAKSTWVSMGVIPLILLYFIRPFLKVAAWSRKVPFACYVL